MSEEPTNVRRLLLIAPSDGALARAPLGERQHVETLLKELLPRLTFDAEGVGTFTRNGLQLRVQLAGDPVLAIELELPLDGAALTPPLERVAAKTGWKLIDPDRPEITPAVTHSQASSQGQSRRWGVIIAMVPLVAGCLWWALAGSRNYVITPDAEAGRKMISTVPADGSSSTPTSASVEEFMGQARAVSAVMARRRALAPEFKDMRVVHELMMINTAELQFRASVGNGNYVDPAMLVMDPSRPGFEGIRMLPAEFVAESRGGYRFEFIGSQKTKTFFEEFDPGYASFVYVASPETAAAGPYTFALISDTARVHYRTDGRVPDQFDPSVTDRVSAEAPPRIKPVPAEPNETKGQSWLRRLINRFISSPVMRDAELTYHEDRAIRDLRVFASAQQAFLATIGGRGFGTPEMLADPSILGLQFREMPPFVDGYFTQEVREGYQFTFEGNSPIRDGALTVYPDFTYVAIPVGDGPPARRSFLLTPDGIIRVRNDGTPPQKSDKILGN